MTRSAVIAPPLPRTDVGGLIPALPPAAISTEPPSAILHLLSPILRQRVQLLSSSNTEPWIRLLCRDTSKAQRLVEIARSHKLEPHPISGEVEIDWDFGVTQKFRRLDEETLQALVIVEDLDLAFTLVFCVVDGDIAQTGWKIGEVSVVEGGDILSAFGGTETIRDAERVFGESKMTPTIIVKTNDHEQNGDENDDDDDGYWDRYDATPGRTPATSRSPAPPSAGLQQTSRQVEQRRSSSDEDAYFAQYDSVQPAMDPHDPDETPITPLHPASHAMATPSNEPNPGATDLYGAGLGVDKQKPRMGAIPEEEDESGEQGGGEKKFANIVHTRPESSSGANGTHAVAKLEETAGKLGNSELGIRKHVSTTIQNLYDLTKAAGIGHSEFEGLVAEALERLRADNSE